MTVFFLVKAVFFLVKATIQYRRSVDFASMVHTTTTDPTDKIVKTKGPAKAKAPAKPRPVARPFKKLDDSVISSRICTMRRQMGIFKSKTTLLGARLEAYEMEDSMRTSKNDSGGVEYCD
jgi:hypothetical protein